MARTTVRFGGLTATAPTKAQAMAQIEDEVRALVHMRDEAALGACVVTNADASRIGVLTPDPQGWAYAVLRTEPYAATAAQPTTLMQGSRQDALASLCLHMAQRDVREPRQWRGQIHPLLKAYSQSRPQVLHEWHCWIAWQAAYTDLRERYPGQPSEWYRNQADQAVRPSQEGAA